MATSSTVPIRPRLIFASSSCAFEIDLLVILVSINPGSTTLLRILYRPISFAIEREYPISDDFVIAYADCPIRRASRTTLPIDTILPFLCFIMCGRTVCVMVRVPRMLVWIIASRLFRLVRIPKLSMLIPTIRKHQ